MKASSNTFVRGTLILSAAVLISKILGLIYVIPLKHIIGEEGIALLSRGYIPYTLILSLATMGIPLAVSKYVAKYNGLGEYRKGKQLLRSSFYLLLGTGFLATVLVYISSPYIVRWLDIPDALWPVRAVSSALLLVPAMAVIRGYFQGWQSMGPTGLSQIIEQMVRVVFILAAAYYLVQIDIPLTITVAIASFGALLGAVAGLIVLLFYWYKRREGIHKIVLESPLQENEEPVRVLYKELFRYALPISFISLAIPLFQLVEWVLYHPVLRKMGYQADQVEAWFGILTSLAHKLMMIPVSLATALALSIIPLITQLYAKKESLILEEKIDQAISLLLYFMIPASVGIFILAKPLYFAIYNDFNGVTMLKWYAPAAIFIALFTVTAAMLQGLQQARKSVFCLSVAVLVKIVLTPLLTLFWIENGAIVATTVGFAVACMGNIIIISKTTSYKVRGAAIQVMKISIAAIIMGGAVFSTLWILNEIGMNATYIHYVIQLLIGSVVGLCVFVSLTWRMPWIRPIIQRFTKGKSNEQTA